MLFKKAPAQQAAWKVQILLGRKA